MIKAEGRRFRKGTQKDIQDDLRDSQSTRVPGRGGRGRVFWQHKHQQRPARQPGGCQCHLQHNSVEAEMAHVGWEACQYGPAIQSCFKNYTLLEAAGGQLMGTLLFKR